MYESQKGIWKLIAPNGDTWEGDSPLHCLRKEKDERIPSSVQLERLAAVLEKDDWISAEERQPESGERVLAIIGGIVDIVAAYPRTNFGRWQYVTHWMPLPSVPGR